MNWWQNNNPYGAPPPYWGPPPQIPVPPGVDPLKVMEFMDRVRRRAERVKEKEGKKDDDPVKAYFKKKTEAGKNFLWYFQAACILYFLSPFIAALQHIVSNLAETVIK